VGISQLTHSERNRLKNSFALTGLACFVCDTRAVEESHYHSHQCQCIHVFKIHGVDICLLFAITSY